MWKQLQDFLKTEDSVVELSSPFIMYTHKRPFGILCLSVLKPKKNSFSSRDTTSFKDRLNSEHFHIIHLEKQGTFETVPNQNVVDGFPSDIMHGGYLGLVPNVLTNM